MIPISKAAKVYGCSRNRIYQFIAKGELNAIEDGGLKLVKEEDVIALAYSKRLRRKVWEESLKSEIGEVSPAA